MAKLLREFYEIKQSEEVLSELKVQNAENKPFVIQGIIQRSDSKNGNGRIYPYEILKKECDRYLEEMVKNKTSFGELDHCLSDDHEILTEDGWKLLKDISENEKVYTLNQITEEIEIETIKRKIVENYDGKLFHLTNGKKLDIMMTPNHKMVLWDRDGEYKEMLAKEAFEFWKSKDSKFSHCSIKNTGKWEGESPSSFTIPGTNFIVSSKAWSAFFGFWLAEGWVAGSKGGSVNSHKVAVVQKKEENISKIREMLFATEMPWVEHKNKDGKYEWSIRNKDLHLYFSQFGNSETKFIPKEFLQWNKNLLSLMLDWMLIGDGRNRSDQNGNLIKELSTISKKMADNTSELFFKLGKGSYIKSYENKDNIIRGKVVLKENCKKLYTVCENKTDSYLDQRFISFEEVPYNGLVYCVTTQNGNFLTRRNNKIVWTGNCDSPVISLKNASHIIEDLWWAGSDNKEVYGKIRLLDTPNGNIAKSIVLSGIPLGISSRAVGSVKKVNDVDVVDEDLQLICFDIVSNPSTSNAYLNLQEIKNFNPRKILPAEIRIKEILDELLNKK